MGIALLLTFAIFGRSIVQYVIFLSGSTEELKGGNTTLYDFDHTKSVKKVFPDLDPSTFDFSEKFAQ